MSAAVLLFALELTSGPIGIALLSPIVLRHLLALRVAAPAASS